MKDVYFIFDGIEEGFYEFWKDKRETGYSEEDRERKWEQISRWVGEYSALIRSVIPNGQIACLVETKQHYGTFSKTDIAHTIEKLGELSQLMYCAERDIFECNHVFGKYNALTRYYISALEQVVWIIASFVNRDKHCAFMDLHDRINMLFGQDDKC